MIFPNFQKKNQKPDIRILINEEAIKMTRNLEKFKEVYLQELRKVHTLGTTEEKRLFYCRNWH